MNKGIMAVLVFETRSELKQKIMTELVSNHLGICVSAHFLALPYQENLPKRFFGQIVTDYTSCK